MKRIRMIGKLKGKTKAELVFARGLAPDPHATLAQALFQPMMTKEETNKYVEENYRFFTDSPRATVKPLKSLTPFSPAALRAFQEHTFAVTIPCAACGDCSGCQKAER